jgi:hypothetical protein
VALPIDEPESRGDFEDIRWFLIHERVSIFVEDDQWYVCFQTPCRHLLPDHRCAIYNRRPRICRRYGADSCDYHSGDYGWQQHFTAPEHLDAYLRQRAGGERGHPARRRPGRPRSPATPGRAARGRSRLPAKREAQPQQDGRGACLPPLPFTP